MTAAQVWEAALGDLQLEMTRANYNTWLKDTFLVDQEEDLFVIGVASPFAADTLEQRLSPLIRKALSRIVGHDVQLRFVVQQKSRGKAPEEMEAPLEGLRRKGSRRPNGQSGSNGAAGKEGQTSGLLGSPLNPRYTFDTFVVGKSNQLAHAACQAVADNPARNYNPLFIYGGVGLGKTHLMHAIGHKSQVEGLKVLYVSSETFTNEMIDSIRDHRTEEFRNKYRKAHVLLVDDIQFIAGKVGTQEEFFHTFNAIHEANGQIVISSDRPPKAIATLEERLRSRFEWGLIADIQPPDLETRIAILRSKCASQGLWIPQEVLEYMARKIQSNIRELEGSLNRVAAYASVAQQPISVELAAKALSDMISSAPKPHVKPEDILEAVAAHYKVSLAAICGKQRDKKVVVPRQVAMYLLKKDASLSLVEIGSHLGGRDHTTVLHGVKLVSEEAEKSGPLVEDLKAIRESIMPPTPA